MLLRLLELQGAGRREGGVQGEGGRREGGSQGEGGRREGGTQVEGGRREVSGEPAEGVSATRPRPSPIVTADSIISTLQMEMATAGLTADAILAATRHLETVVRAPLAAERPCIAPRPSLGRLGGRGEGGEGAGEVGRAGGQEEEEGGGSRDGHGPQEAV